MPAEENVIALLSEAIEKKEENITAEAVSVDGPGDLPAFDAVDMDDETEEKDVVEWVGKSEHSDDDEEPDDDKEQPEPESAEKDDAEEDDEPKGVPELRKAYKDRKNEIRELRKQVAEFEARKQAPAAAPVQAPKPMPVPERSTDLSPEAIIEGYAKLENGELEERYRPQLVQFVSELSPDDLARVQQQAMLGQFGEYNADILKYAGQFLPFSQQSYAKRQSFAAVEAQRRQIREQSLAEIVKVDGVADPNSEIGKEFRQAAIDLGDILGREVLDSIPQAPLLVRDFVELRKQAASASQVPALQKENAELKAQLARVTSPARGGTGHRQGTEPRKGASSALGDLREALRQAGNRNA